MSYTRLDVDLAKQAITSAFPYAMFSETDYGYGLGVCDGANMRRGAVTVFQPRRDNIGQPEIITSVPDVLDWLNGKEPPMSLTLPLYQSHKQVRAAEIVSVDPSIRRIRISYPGEVVGGDATTLTQTVMVEQSWIDRFQPQAGQYLVQYASGYLSVSPATEFVEGYSPIDEDQADDRWTGADPELNPLGKKPAGTPLAQPAPEPQAKSSGLSHDESQGGF